MVLTFLLMMMETHDGDTVRHRDGSVQVWTSFFYHVSSDGRKKIVVDSDPGFLE
jgi:hypothetical protein